MKYDKEKIISGLTFSDYQRLIPSLKTGAGDKAQGLCPFHDDHNPSLSIDLSTGRFKCFGCNKSGSVFDLYQKVNGTDFKAALEALAGWTGVSEENRPMQKEKESYDYTDESGNRLFQVVRFEPKTFKQRRPDDKGGWTWKMQGVRLVLYNLPAVLRTQEVYVVEGEKDADNLNRRGLVATTNAQGAGKWRPEYSDTLTGKDVVILPDNDEPGKNHAQKVAESLHGKVKSLKVVELPGLPYKGDVSDWLMAGHTKEELIKMVHAAPEWEPNKEEVPGLVFLDTVKPEPIEWLWQGYIPLGKITIIDGDPGLGKSSIVLDLIARTTTGRPLPDNTYCPRGGAVLIALEDGLADTLRPRLEAAGANLNKVASLQTVPDGEGNPRFPTIEDISGIRRACIKAEARILLVDPLMAHLDGKTNSYRDQDVRRALTPLAKLAEELNMAVIVIRHLTKGEGGKAVHKGGGSIGIIGQARSAYLVAKDPEDESLRIFACVKNNLAVEPSALSYRLKEAEINYGDKNIVTSRIEWVGTSRHTANTLIAIPGDPEEKSALEEAKDFLKEILSGGPVVYPDIRKQVNQAGIADITIRRAKKALGIFSKKLQFGSGWAWELPAEDAQNEPKVLIKKDEHLGEKMSIFGKQDESKHDGTDEPIEVLEVIE